MCNHKLRINIMSCLRNSTVRREIGQLLLRNRSNLMTTTWAPTGVFAFFEFVFNLSPFWEPFSPCGGILLLYSPLPYKKFADAL